MKRGLVLPIALIILGFCFYFPIKSPKKTEELGAKIIEVTTPNDNKYCKALLQQGNKKIEFNLHSIGFFDYGHEKRRHLIIECKNLKNGNTTNIVAKKYNEEIEYFWRGIKGEVLL